MKSYTVYKCEHCCMPFATEESCLSHEESCTSDPMFKKCASCRYAENMNPTEKRCGIPILYKCNYSYYDNHTCEKWVEKTNKN